MNICFCFFCSQLDNKDKELQDARDLIEDLKRQNRLLSKEINKSEVSTLVKKLTVA